MEETALQANVPLVPVEPPETLLTLLPGVPNTTGVNHAANALFRTKVEEMLTP